MLLREGAGGAAFGAEGVRDAACVARKQSQLRSSRALQSRAVGRKVQAYWGPLFVSQSRSSPSLTWRSVRGVVDWIMRGSCPL